MTYLLLTLILAEFLALFLLSKLVSNALSKVFLRITKSQTLSSYLLFFLFLPGILLHELSHIIVSILLFVPVGNVEFVPRIREGGVQMGSVMVGKTDPIRRLLIGLAPVLGGFLILLFLFFSWQTSAVSEGLKYVISIFIIFEVTNTMFSSSKDLEGAAVLGIVALLLAVFLNVSGAELPGVLYDLLKSDQSINILKKIATLLLIPLAINTSVVFSSRLIRS